jgi:2-polyprenyl-3-methyl-5-hydroxy-6-metoxy-1,4-benzoquinol methylase
MRNSKNRMFTNSLTVKHDKDLIPNSVRLENIKCPMGCSNNDSFLFSARDRIHELPGIFNVVRCNTCGLMRTNPRPTPVTIGYYYTDEYGPFRGTRINEEVSGNYKLKTKIIASLKKVIAFKTNTIPELTPGRLLEIGCASGSFLYKMQKRNWFVQGIEPSTTACQNARKHGINVFNGSVESAPAPEQPYDLIVGWMVLEHLHDPVGALKLLNKWSKPGGWIVLSVPNADCMEFRLFRHEWYALQLPTHLYHFTPTTLKNLLFKCGWKTEKIIHQRNISNLIASCGYWMQDRKIMPFIADWMTRFPEKQVWLHALFYPISAALGAFGQTGRMTIWARNIKEPVQL